VVLTFVDRFKSLKFLLTDSKIPRDTKRLVAGVTQLKQDVSLFLHCSVSFTLTAVCQKPELVNGVLESIQSISDEARRALADPELSREAILSALSVNTSYLLSVVQVLNMAYS
jgi:mevalonate kinase